MSSLIIRPTQFNIRFVIDQINANANGQNGQLVPKLPIDQLEGFETKNISEGVAFLSKIFRLIFHWKEPRADLPESIVMKVPGPQHKHLMGDEGEGDEKPDAESEDPDTKWLCEYLVDAHKREISFYRHFPQLQPTLRVPEFYFGSPYHPSHREGLILMEDLSIRGSTVPLLPGFNHVQVLELIAEMAKLHATSWLFPEWEQKVCSEDFRHSAADLVNGMIAGASKLKELNHQLGPLIERLLPIFTESQCAFASYSGSKFGFPASIVHADLYSSNILWEKDAQGRPTDRLLAIIDWQSCHPGNPCQDLCRMLALNTPGEYRRENMPRLLDFYAGKVAESMGGQAPFSKEQLVDAFNHALPFCTMFLCYGMPFYHEMDSIVGTGPEEREGKRRELLERCRMFLEDTAQAAGV